MTREALAQTEFDRTDLAPGDPAVPQSVPATTPTEVVPLRQVLRRVARDSRNRPEQYLHETRVIGGGE